MKAAELPSSPYKGLMPYTKEDAPFFFGRDREEKLITANLMASRLTLLYGPSGVGKSSVINAGVVSHLQEVARKQVSAQRSPESIAITFSTWRDNPSAVLKNRISTAINDLLPGKQCEPSFENRAELADYLEKCCENTGSELLIILDQFEEYFLYHSLDAAAGTFADELPSAINRQGLRANFIISIREDALAKLDFFKGRVPHLFENYLRIEHLKRTDAVDAVKKPIDKYNSLNAGGTRIEIEQKLVDAVLNQVRIGEVLWSGSGRGKVDDTGSEDRIETPYLQLVMTRLWQEEMSRHSNSLRLQTLNKLGGAINIVRTHLDLALSTLLISEQEIASKIFRYLVTPSGSKIALSTSDLANYTELSEVQLESVLQRLTAHDVRILRPINPPAGTETATRYEIFHDVLATSILDWQTRFMYTNQLKRSLKGLILPCILGMIADTIICFVPSGAILVWLMLRRKALALQKELVNKIALGWGIGWAVGFLVYAVIYVIFMSMSSAFRGTRGEDVALAIIILALLVTRLFGPLGSLLAVERWRRKARKKFGARATTVTKAA